MTRTPSVVQRLAARAEQRPNRRASVLDQPQIIEWIKEMLAYRERCRLDGRRVPIWADVFNELKALSEETEGVVPIPKAMSVSSLKSWYDSHLKNQ